jgi:tectonin-like protein
VETVEGMLTQLSIGSPTDIWGVNKSNNSVWRIPPGGWQRMAGQMSYVAVAKGGGGVVAIDLNGRPYYWREPDWIALPNTPTPLKQIEIGKPGNTYRRGLQDQIYKWIPPVNSWKTLRGQLSNISVAPDGTIGGTNSNKQSRVVSATSVDTEVTDGSPAAWVAPGEQRGGRHRDRSRYDDPPE